MKIALLGTRGVPARYGGFETAAEEIGARLVERGHDVVVYARNQGQQVRTYRGIQVVNLPALRHRATETLSHSGLSMLHAVTIGRPEVAFVFNAANAPYIRPMQAAGIPVAMHVDGLEWKRAKWDGAGASYYRRAERWSVKWADAVISDARGIADHVRGTYGRESDFIAYGAPILHPSDSRLSELGLRRHGFHLVVARFEPENHVDLIVDGYVRSDAQLPLVVVGASPYGDSYVQQVHRAAGGEPRVQFTGAIWDQDLLDQLYGNCLTYVHGHSVGGTNPSLLRAMGAAAPVLAYDVVFNREVTGGHARFFSSSLDVGLAVTAAELDPDKCVLMGEKGRTHVAAHYQWDQVAEAYEALALRLEGCRNSRDRRGG